MRPSLINAVNRRACTCALFMLLASPWAYAVPTVTQFDSAVTEPTNALTVDFSLTFSEAVLNTDITDFAPINVLSGALSFVSYSIVEAAGIYTLSVQGLSGTGNFRVDFDGATDIVDGVGGALVPSSSEVITVDTVAPSVVLSGAASGCAGSLVTATFSEPVAGVNGADFVFTNATPGVFTPVSPTVYTRAFLATGAAVTVNMAAGAAQDPATNNSTIAAQYNYTADMTNPTVVLSGAASGCAANIVTATFSEPVTGVTGTDFVLSNATPGTFTTVSPTQYTMTFTATAAAVSVNMAAGAAQDLCLINSTAAAPKNYTADVAAPIVVLSYPGGPISCPTTVTVTFNEAVSGLLLTEITASAGTVSALAGGPTVYTVTVTPPGVGSGNINLNLAAGSAQDACGNNNAAATQLTVPYSIPLNPTLVLSGAASGCAAGTATATFDSAVTGMTAGDFVFTNATPGTFTAVSTTVYTMTFTATAAAVTVNIPAGAATRVTGCSGPSAASNTYNYSADFTAPSVVLSGAASGCAAGTVTATFSEGVTGVLAADFALTNATAGTFTPVSSTQYTMTFTATNTFVSVNMAASAAQDLCGRNSTAAAVKNYTADLIRPSVFIGGGATSGCAAGSATVTFDEIVSGLTASDFNVGGATVGALTGGPISYNLAFTATSSTVNIGLPANVAVDSCGHLNFATVFDHIYTADITAPSVVLSGAATGCASGLVTATFSEPVTGVNGADFVLTNATAGAFTPVSSTVYTRAFTATGAAVTANMAAGVASDAGACNTNTAALAYNYTADLTAPTVVLSGAATGCASSLVTATFSEPVTGVAASDFSLTNGTAGTFTAVSTTVYTLAFTAIAAAVSMQFRQDMSIDACSNLNTFSNVYNYTADLTAPTVTLSTLAASGCAANTVTATFSEDVSGVSAADFVMPAATKGLFTPVDARTYTLAFTANTSPVTINMAVNAATDGCNTSAAATQISYAADLSAPTVVLSILAASGCAANTVTATFSEDVSGVGAADFVMPAATKGLFTQVDARNYTLAFTANTSLVTINMAGGAATDGCNTSAAATQISYAADLSDPSVVLSTTTASGCAANTVTATFSEDVSGVSAADFVMPAATKGLFTPVDARTYTLAFAANTSPVTINMAGGAATDGCNNSAAATQISYAADLAAPSVVLSGPVGTQTAMFIVNINFSESVSGFTQADIGASAGATLNNFSGTGTSYSVEVTPDCGATGTINITVGASVGNDVCLNGNTAATPLVVPFDILVGPTLVFTQPSSQTVSEGSPSAALVTFSVAPVSGGIPPYTYEWFYVGTGTPTNLSGVLTDTLTITGVTQADNEGDYYCVVTDSAPCISNTIQTNNATLTVSLGTPAMGFLGLGALAAALAGGAVSAMRRRKK